MKHVALNLCCVLLFAMSALSCDQQQPTAVEATADDSVLISVPSTVTGVWAAPPVIGTAAAGMAGGTAPSTGEAQALAAVEAQAELQLCAGTVHPTAHFLTGFNVCSHTGWSCNSDADCWGGGECLANKTVTALGTSDPPGVIQFSLTGEEGSFSDQVEVPIYIGSSGYGITDVYYKALDGGGQTTIAFTYSGHGIETLLPMCNINCPIDTKVFSVTSIEFDDSELTTKLDPNPDELGGGFRIFPGRNSPDDEVGN
ncbi:hypothetical protein ACFL3S_07910, partial [Gemmatimonadota bacterium]